MNTATLTRSAAPHLPQARAAGLSQWLGGLVARLTAPAAPAVQTMDSGATVWVGRPLGRTITCQTGTLWLAFDGEPEDVILEAGQSHRCAKGSRLSIHALAAAQVRVN